MSDQSSSPSDFEASSNSSRLYPGFLQIVQSPHCFTLNFSRVPMARLPERPIASDRYYSIKSALAGALEKLHRIGKTILPSHITLINEDH